MNAGPRLAAFATREAVDDFYRLRVPVQFNETLARQRAEAAADPGAARRLEEMEAVRTAIVVEVERAADVETYAYAIERGHMSSADAPARTPFLRLRHTEADFDAIRRHCGNSLLGFLGALAGLGDAMCLTAQRVRSLRELAACVVLERTGADGFTLTARFGEALREGGPDARIRLEPDVHERLREGLLDAQDAFLAGEIPIEGDEAVAIGLALAAMSPD